MDFLNFFTEFLNLVILLLLTYMFFRLIFSLYKKDILKKEDIFYITSTPWEYKKYKNKEGS